MFFNHGAGFEYVKKLLVSYGFTLESLHPYNFGRHLLVKTDKQIFYVLFKRSPIHSFNSFNETQSFLKSHPECRGWGESINVDYAMLAKKHNAVLLYVYEDESCYIIPSSQIVEKCSQYRLVRYQEKKNSHTKTDDPEKEYVFPMRWMVAYK